MSTGPAATAARVRSAPSTGETPGAPAAVRSLYLHVPFCERRCEYCDFAALAGRDSEAEYAAALRAEVAALAARLGRLELDSVFVGGGTPSFMAPRLLSGILDQVRDGFVLSSACEVTLEANPSSTSEGRAHLWLEAGFNRVSIGIQSLEPDILGYLGRVHDAARAVAAVGEVRRAGFRRVSCDLIYAVPGLDDGRWLTTLERVVALGTGHVSAYELTVEPGTRLHAKVRRGERPPVDAEVALRQHRMAVAVLGAAGLAQYEVSNFARPGEECRHNLACWRRGHYLAAGLGAHGHLSVADARRLGLAAPADAVSVRYWHGRSLRAYLSPPTGSLPIAGSEAVDAAQAESERVMLGLRLAEGLSASATWGVRGEALATSGLLWSRDGRMGATARGQEVLDELVRELAG